MHDQFFDAAQPLPLAINPVSWRTDATPALLVDPRYGDTLTVTLDTTSLLLYIDGYTRDDYMLPFIGCEGNYHCLEISLFCAPQHSLTCLESNQNNTIKNWFSPTNNATQLFFSPLKKFFYLCIRINPNNNQKTTT